VLTGQVGGAARPAVCHQRSQPGPGAGDVLVGQVGAGPGVERAQQVGDVLGGALRVVDRAVVGGVGGADVGVVAPRHDEHRPLVATDGQDHADVVAHPVPRHGQVDALGRGDRAGVGRLVQGPHVVGKHAPGVDDRCGGDREALAVGLRLHAVDDPSRCLGQAQGPHPVGRHGALVEHGGADHCQHQPGVVGRGVVIDVGAADLVGGQGGHVGDGLGGVDPLMELADAPAAGGVVGPHGGAQRARQLLGDQPVFGKQRQQKRLDVHQVRGVGQQPPALVQRLVHQRHVALLQVAQPAVHQLGALRRGARGKVAAVDQGGAQAPGSGVEGDAGAGDTAPDHHQVEVSGPQRLQRLGSLEGCLLAHH